jgi:hypothetical protein
MPSKSSPPFFEAFMRRGQGFHPRCGRTETIDLSKAGHVQAREDGQPRRYVSITTGSVLLSLVSSAPAVLQLGPDLCFSFCGPHRVFCHGVPTRCITPLLWFLDGARVTATVLALSDPEDAALYGVLCRRVPLLTPDGAVYLHVPPVVPVRGERSHDFCIRLHTPPPPPPPPASRIT